MKTKLTLTVKKTVILKAKRFSKRTGKSISEMVEEFFENMDAGGKTKSQQQKAAERLLEALQVSKAVQTLDDKQLIKNHVAGKFT